MYTSAGLLVASLAACRSEGERLADADGDGLTDGMEIELGSDPTDADTDDDGVEDGAELSLGGDPLNVDTDSDGLDDGAEVGLGTALNDSDSDDDGYTDRDEDWEGKDPLDPRSVIYQGGWPYSFEKTELNGGVVFEEGKRFANLQLEDQFGDVVSLWDFHNDSRYVIVDLCVGWGPLCENLSRWVAGERGPSFAAWSPVADAVDAGDLHWITILSEDETPGVPITSAEVTEWAGLHSHELVPVLADPDSVSTTFVELNVFPYLVLLDPELKVRAIQDDTVGYTGVLDAALAILAP